MTIKKDTLVAIIENATGCTVLKINAKETEELGNQVITATTEMLKEETLKIGKRVESLSQKFNEEFIYIIDTHTLLNSKYEVIA